jgi:hypothetical protein
MPNSQQFKQSREEGQQRIFPEELDAKPVLEGALSPLQNEQTTPQSPGVLSAMSRE